jgi:N,N'-diacetylbacillosaminyl-diphospho-undecaprenol alpha-1,3-N-acetylgalactosaminyltransferase
MIIHFIHHPVSAKRFVEPLVDCLNKNNFKTELWVENKIGFEQFINQIACPVNFCKFDISPNPFQFIFRCLSLIKKLRKLNPKAVHAHQTRAALIPLLAACICRIPIRIYHNHGIPYIGYKGFFRFFLFALEKINCRLATNVITVSPTLKSIIERDINPPNGCCILGNGSACGIDLSEFPKNPCSEEEKQIYRKELGIPEKSFVALFCGRPVKRKGIDVLFSAWEKTKINRDKLLLLAGVHDSDLKRKWKTIPGIKPLGFVSNMKKLYSASDIVVLPSFHEGTSYTILEAFASFRTVIACDIPGNDYIIKNQVNGFLIQPGDWIELKNKLEQVSENKSLRNLELAARETIEKKFDRRICLNNLIDFYSELNL